MNHTQAPWFLDQYGHVYGWKQTSDTTKTSVLLIDNRHSEATTKDKLLISAAPELLEALQAYVAATSEVDFELAQALKLARAAIAKAGGAA